MLYVLFYMFEGRLNFPPCENAPALSVGRLTSEKGRREVLTELESPNVHLNATSSCHSDRLSPLSFEGMRSNGYAAVRRAHVLHSAGLHTYGRVAAGLVPLALRAKSDRCSAGVSKKRPVPGKRKSRLFQ